MKWQAIHRAMNVLTSVYIYIHIYACTFPVGLHVHKYNTIHIQMSSAWQSIGLSVT